MVEINNQRKAFLDMLAWSEGTDNGRRRNLSYDVIVKRRAIYWLLRSPSQTCHAKPKTQINRAPDATSFFPVGGMPYRKQLGLKALSEKSGRCGVQQIKERGALPMIDRGDINQAIDPLQQYLGFTAGRWLWSVRA